MPKLSATPFLAPSAAPPQRLFIYYLDGRVPEELFAGEPGYLGNWEEDGHSFLFFARPSLELVRDKLAGHGGIGLRQHFDVDYRDWLGGRLESMTIGRFTVRPAWEEATPETEGPAVRFDPGVVFGSGIHPTTRSCIQALDRVLSMAEVDLAADLGCGTGLLSLAAAKLGARRVVAVDQNPLAARTARGNIRRNGLEERVLPVQGRAEDFAALPAELVMANIHYEVLRRLCAMETFWSRKWLVISGVLPKQAAWLQEELGRRGAQLVSTWGQAEGWPTFLLHTSDRSERSRTRRLHSSTLHPDISRY